MQLLRILDESVIKVPLESDSKEEAIEEMVEILVRAGRIADRDSALKAIDQRESRQSTGIGKGLAVPHGKDPAVDELVGAVGISREGIDYDSIDSQPVHAIILLIAQPDHPGPHVAALAEIAHIFSRPSLRQAFCDARDAATVLEIIRSIE